MIPRISIVDNINITSCDFTTVFNIGDAKFIDCSREYLSVKRNETTFFEPEGDTMKRYEIFSEVPSFEPIYEKINMTFTNDIPYIRVLDISIIGIAGAFLHVGYGDSINLENKILNLFEQQEKPHFVGPTPPGTTHH